LFLTSILRYKSAQLPIHIPIGWGQGDDGHVDLVLHEYSKVEIGATTYITINLNSFQGATTCNSFVYYSKPRTSFHNDEEEPTPYALDKSESLSKSPPDFVHDMTNFYYTYLLARRDFNYSLNAD
jgi:hypothetical protein